MSITDYLNGTVPHFGVILCAAICLIGPARVIKEVELDEQIVVKRYLWKQQTYEYADVIHVGPGAVMLKDDTIWLGKVNREEDPDGLQELMQEAESRGYIRKEQMSDESILMKVYAREIGPYYAAALTGLLVTWGIWSTSLSESLVAYIEAPGAHPFLMTAAIIALLFYFPLDHLAKRAAKNL
jgi:hypothetical protein